GHYFQVIVPDRRPGIVHVDASDWDEICVSQYLEEKANAILDVVNGELWRWYLVGRPHDSVILFTFHHSICDLETINILIEVLFAECAKNATGVVGSTASYADFADRQYEFLESDAGRRSRLAWDRALQDVDL